MVHVQRQAVFQCLEQECCISLSEDNGIGEEARAGEKGGLGGQCERLRAALMMLPGWLVGLAVVPHWVRGQEWCTMLSPRRDYRVSLLGLGTSVGTGPQGITAQVGQTTR